MNRKKVIPLYILALAGGCAGFSLRWTLRKLAGGGLEPTGTWLPAAAIAILLAVTLFTVLYTRQLEEDGSYHGNFPASAFVGVCSWVSAVMLFLQSFVVLLERPEQLTMMVELLGVLSAIALLFTGWCRYSGRRPNFLYHAVVCVYYGLHLVSSYRQWSAEPQMGTYMYQLLALAALTLASYYRCAFDTNQGARKPYLRCLFPALALCLTAMADGNWMLYAAGALWLGSSPCAWIEHE